MPWQLTLGVIDRKMGDPLDLDELEMQRRYTYKHQMSIEMEQAIDLVLYQNNYEEIRRNLLKTCLMTASVLSKTLTTREDIYPSC